MATQVYYGLKHFFNKWVDHPDEVPNKLAAASAAKPMVALSQNNSAGGAGFDFDSLEKMQRYHSFLKNGPSFGLNLVAKCGTSRCALHEEDCVIIEKGIGKFDLAREIFQIHPCPGCRQDLSLFDILFVDCKYTIEGKQISPERKIVKYNGEARIIGANLVRKANARWLTLEVTTVMPIWKMRKNGLNLEGYCRNKLCESILATALVFVHIPGNGPHDLSKLAPKCSLCNHPIDKISSIWLKNCTFTINMKSPDGQPCNTKYLSYPKDQGYLYQEDLFVTLTNVDPD